MQLIQHAQPRSVVLVHGEKVVVRADVLEILKFRLIVLPPPTAAHPPLLYWCCIVAGSCLLSNLSVVWYMMPPLISRVGPSLVPCWSLVEEDVVPQAKD